MIVLAVILWIVASGLAGYFYNEAIEREGLQRVCMLGVSFAYLSLAIYTLIRLT